MMTLSEGVLIGHNGDLGTAARLGFVRRFGGSLGFRCLGGLVDGLFSAADRISFHGIRKHGTGAFYLTDRKSL